MATLPLVVMVVGRMSLACMRHGCSAATAPKSQQPTQVRHRSHLPPAVPMTSPPGPPPNPPRKKQNQHELCRQRQGGRQQQCRALPCRSCLLTRARSNTDPPPPYSPTATAMPPTALAAASERLQVDQ